MSAEVRLRRLQQLVLDPGFLGLEPLLDLLLGVHQELGASDLAQDKYVADFLQWGEYLPACPLPTGRWGRAEAGNGIGRQRLLEGRADMGRASYSGAQSLGLGLGVTCPYPCATLAGQWGQQRPGQP